MASRKAGRRRHGWLVAGLALAWLWAAAAPGLAANQFISLSDPHFNPLAQPELVPELVSADVGAWASILSRAGRARSHHGQETNFALLASTLPQLHEALPDPDFLVFTGDILAHDFDQRYAQITGDHSQAGVESFILKTVTFFADQLHSSYPDKPIYFCLGNNDAYEGDYLVQPGGRFLADSAGVFASRFLRDPRQRSEFLAEYPAGGYYSLDLDQGAGARLISLNSVLFSVNHPGDDAGARQLDWLEAELAAAEDQGQSVLLLSHIPPGANVYNIVHDPANSADRIANMQSFWRDEPTERFTSLLERYAGTVGAVFSGHTHMDDLRLAYAQGQTGARSLEYVHITPALSPQFGNNPGFAVVDYSPLTAEAVNFTGYGLDAADAASLWQARYGFCQAYGKASINPQSLDQVYRDIAAGGEAAQTYMGHYNVGSQASPFNPGQLKAYACGIGRLLAQDYVRCYERGSLAGGGR